MISSLLLGHSGSHSQDFKEYNTEVTKVSPNSTCRLFYCSYFSQFICSITLSLQSLLLAMNSKSEIRHLLIEFNLVRFGFNVCYCFFCIVFHDVVFFWCRSHLALKYLNLQTHHDASLPNPAVSRRGDSAHASTGPMGISTASILTVQVLLSLTLEPGVPAAFSPNTSTSAPQFECRQLTFKTLPPPRVQLTDAPTVNGARASISAGVSIALGV